MSKKERTPKTVQEYRVAVGLTQMDLANIIGCDKSTIGYYEAKDPSRRKIPGLDMASKLADALGISLEELAIAFGVRDESKEVKIDNTKQSPDN